MGPGALAAGGRGLLSRTVARLLWSLCVYCTPRTDTYGATARGYRTKKYMHVHHMCALYAMPGCFECAIPYPGPSVRALSKAV